MMTRVCGSDSPRRQLSPIESWRRKREVRLFQADMIQGAPMYVREPSNAGAGTAPKTRPAKAGQRPLKGRGRITTTRDSVGAPTDGPHDLASHAPLANGMLFPPLPRSASPPHSPPPKPGSRQGQGSNSRISLYKLLSMTQTAVPTRMSTDPGDPFNVRRRSRSRERSNAEERHQLQHTKGPAATPRLEERRPRVPRDREAPMTSRDLALHVRSNSIVIGDRPSTQGMPTTGRSSRKEDLCYSRGYTNDDLHQSSINVRQKIEEFRKRSENDHNGRHEAVRSSHDISRSTGQIHREATNLSKASKQDSYASPAVHRKALKMSRESTKLPPVPKLTYKHGQTSNATPEMSRRQTTRDSLKHPGQSEPSLARGKSKDSEQLLRENSDKFRGIKRQFIKSTEAAENKLTAEKSQSKSQSTKGTGDEKRREHVDDDDTSDEEELKAKQQRPKTTETWKTWRDANESYAYNNVAEYIRENELMSPTKEQWITNWVTEVDREMMNQIPEETQSQVGSTMGGSVPV